MAHTHFEVLLRILLGTFLGAVIGFERDLHGRPAGLRTHSIVALAASAFMVVSTRFVFFQHYLSNDLVEVDPSRIAASVVSGIGFLGAGAILRTGLTVRGLTTAAGLWLVAAIGMAAGGGMYVVATFTTAVGLGTLTLLRRLEDRGAPAPRQRVTIVLGQNGATPTDALAALEGAGIKAVQEEYSRDVAQGDVTLVLEIGAAKAHPHDQLAAPLARLQGIRRIHIQRI